MLASCGPRDCPRGRRKQRACRGLPLPSSRRLGIFPRRQRLQGTDRFRSSAKRPWVELGSETGNGSTVPIVGTETRAPAWSALDGLRRSAWRRARHGKKPSLIPGRCQQKAVSPQPRRRDAFRRLGFRRVRRFSVANPLDFRDQATLNLASDLRTFSQFITAGDTPKVRMPGGTRMHALVPSFVGPHDKPKPVAVVSDRPGARREAGLEQCVRRDDLAPAAYGAPGRALAGAAPRRR